MTCTRCRTLTLRNCADVRSRALTLREEIDGRQLTRVIYWLRKYVAANQPIFHGYVRRMARWHQYPDDVVEEAARRIGLRGIIWRLPEKEAQ